MTTAYSIPANELILGEAIREDASNAVLDYLHVDRILLLPSHLQLLALKSTGFAQQEIAAVRPLFHHRHRLKYSEGFAYRSARDAKCFGEVLFCEVVADTAVCGAQMFDDLRRQLCCQ